MPSLTDDYAETEAAWLPAPTKGVRITNNKNVNVPLNKSQALI